MIIDVERDQAFLTTIRRIADEVAAPHAAAVDHEARFPMESVAALREAGALSALIPARYGGQDLGLDTIALAAFERPMSPPTPISDVTDATSRCSAATRSR